MRPLAQNGDNMTWNGTLEVTKTSVITGTTLVAAITWRKTRTYLSTMSSRFLSSTVTPMDTVSCS